jgi:hypothetical protein
MPAPFFVRLALIAAAVFLARPNSAEDRVDFAREVLPILSNKCFACHGPDTQEEDLVRLDSFIGATNDLGGYKAIDPDAPESGVLIERVNSDDDPMPPEDFEKPLTDAERELLTRWARQGGEYATHWAFVPPHKHKPSDSTLNVIDAFIQDGLRGQEIEFAPPADRATLARRAALVLTGLPPEPELLESLLASRADDAYERLIDRLLDSPRYGEHQARYWLDAVRYGDTHGLHLDNRRSIFPYRDWVIHAFNENLALDQFITWQLAGDLQPEPSLAQRVATGYVRLNPTTSEGGAIPEEFQAKNNFDRVETLGTVFLGMSLTCARCHTHKYDPITQTEYYQLLAFFNNTAEPPMDGNAYVFGPTIRAPQDVAQWDLWNALESRRDAFLARVALSTEQQAAAVDWANKRSSWKSSDWKMTKPVAADAPPAAEDWQTAKGLPGVIAGRKSRDLLPKDKQATWLSFNVQAPEKMALQLSFTSAPGWRVDRGGETIRRSPDRDKSTSDMTVATRTVGLWLPAGSHQIRVQVIGSDRTDSIEARLTHPWDALLGKVWNSCSPSERLSLLSERRGPLAKLGLQKDAGRIMRQIRRTESAFATTLVAEDLSTPRPTRLLRRGEYDLPTGPPLTPEVLSAMGTLPEGAPRNRLGLAQWLTSRDNPIVARVLVNRIWQRTFGHGLVRTPEDFGLQGEQPTHPQLLDWLAVELQDSGWDLKHMLRLMVTSRTFRQNSRWRPEFEDPENRWFARGPRHRLDAETLRDIALWASGLLDPVMGGDGVKPYQPSGMWKALMHPASNTKDYVRDEGTRLYRRSLYVYWKRTSPHPMMTLFDAPNRELSCVRRSRTNTPLQSLALLNETQRIEMSRKLAERLLREAEADSDRLDRLFTLLICREPTDGERDACDGLLRQMRSRFAASPQDASDLLAVGDAPSANDLDAAELAAWTQVAVTVLASDAALLLY